MIKILNWRGEIGIDIECCLFVFIICLYTLLIILINQILNLLIKERNNESIIIIYFNEK